MKLKTACGEISREELGVVTTHEHVLLDLTAFYREQPVEGIPSPSTQKVEMWTLGTLNRDCYALKDNLLLDNEALQAEELARFKTAGGTTVVDASLPGIGRDPEALRRIAEKTGLHIVMGTGYYVGETHPEALSAMTEQQIADEMIRELEVGADGTDICAGYIGEIGISEIFDEKERRVLRAAALAQKATGVAINVHINPWTVNGLEAADILLDAGVAPDRICISHIDVENREDYVLGLLRKGVYVEFDNFGKEYYIRREVRNSGYGLFVTDVQRVTFLKRLIDLGYLNRVLLSCDLCLKQLLHTYGGWGYDHVLKNIVPMMEDEGITAQQIHTLLVKNPANWLLGEK